MLKSREKYHPLYFSAVVGNFYKGREQSRFEHDKNAAHLEMYGFR